MFIPRAASLSRVIPEDVVSFDTNRFQAEHSFISIILHYLKVCFGRAAHWIKQAATALWHASKIPDLLRFIGKILLRGLEWCVIAYLACICIWLAVRFTRWGTPKLREAYAKWRERRRQKQCLLDSERQALLDTEARRALEARERARLAEEEERRTRVEEQERITRLEEAERRKKAEEEVMRRRQDEEGKRKSEEAEERNEKPEGGEKRTRTDADDINLAANLRRLRQARLDREIKEKQKAEEEKRKAKAKAEYKTWESQCRTAFQNRSSMTTFPVPPLLRCTMLTCEAFAKAPVQMCQHNIRQFFINSANDSLEFLKHQKNLWHEDKFAACREDVREEFKRLGNVMFVVLNGWYEEV